MLAVAIVSGEMEAALMARKKQLSTTTAGIVREALAQYLQLSVLDRKPTEDI